MSIKEESENIVLVNLSQEPQKGTDIEEITEIVRNRDNCDVVIDFSDVEIITSSNLTEFLKLNKMLTDCGHRLLFCNVTASIKAIFIVTGLDQVFEFAEDKSVALSSL